MTCVCVMPYAVQVERDRLAELGATFLGSCGNELHTYGFHLPPCRLPADDYSLRYGRGPENQSAAGDFGMDWEGSRTWLALFITELRAGAHPGVVEVIGSLDGKTVNYWCRWQGWKTTRYTGQGHDTWTHIGFDRTRTQRDQLIFEGGSVPLSQSDIDKVSTAAAAKVMSSPVRGTQTSDHPKPRTLEENVGDLQSNLLQGRRWPQSSDQDLDNDLAALSAKVDKILALLTPAAPPT